MPPPHNSNDSLDLVKRQYMKRATSLLVRTAGYDSASAFALDALCDVGILYMQSLFSQAHAYGEHATRTRPNMNDVGRALDQRYVTVGTLAQHMERERQTKDSQAKVIRMMRRGAEKLAEEAERVGEFFDDRAEALLRRVVEHKKEAIREEAEREREARERVEEERRAAEAAAASAASASAAAAVLERGGERTVTFGEDRIIAEDDEDEDDEFETPEESHRKIQQQQQQQQQQGQVGEGEEGGGDADKDANMPTSPPLPPAAAATEKEKESNETTACDRQLAEIDRLLLPAATLPAYIPKQCPVFPSPHTYKRTAVFPKREQDVFVTRMHKAEQSRQAEENLQRLVTQSAVALEQQQQQEQKQLAPSKKDRKAQGARQRIQDLFPPANFRHVDKRARLSSQTL